MAPAHDRQVNTGARVVVARLRARREEIVQEMFVRVREAVSDPVGERDTEYMAGLRATVAAAVDYALNGLEYEGGRPVSIPAQAVAQAHHAARVGVSLDAVLRRYIAGHALLWDYVMEEADRVERAGGSSGLREMSRAQALLLDDLVRGVTREHMEELGRAGRSRGQRLSERVRELLTDDRAHVDGRSGGLELDADYDLHGWHVGAIGRGAEAETELQSLAQHLDRRLLCVDRGAETVWAWLGGHEGLQTFELERAMTMPARDDRPTEVALALGEPARGFEGWRLTHQQAQAALMVALRRPQRVTRYADVALLAAALKDDLLARTLIDTYLVPLEGGRGGGGPVLVETLRAYVAAEHNASSAASGLRVARKTVENRLRTIEERLGRTVHPCPAELEVALHLDDVSLTKVRITTP